MISNALDASIPREARSALPAFDWFDIAADAAGWDYLAAGQPHSLFNSSAMLQAHAGRGSRPLGIVLPRSDGSVLALGGVACLDRKRRSWSCLAFPPLAATDDPDLVKTLIAWLQARGIRRIKLGSYTSGVDGYHLPTGDAVAHQRMEFIWSLETTPEARFKALRSNHKRKLQRLRKQPFQLRKLRRWQAVHMTRLRLQWGQRRALNCGIVQLMDIYLHYRQLQRCLTRAGIGHLYGLYDEQQRLLSLAYMLEAGDMAFYMIGASSAAGYRHNASLRLFWDLAEQYQARGFRCLHLGGVPAAARSAAHEEHGVQRFKAGFGIEPIGRTSLLIGQ